MDTDTLLSKVFLRPATWDKILKVYTNRAFVDNCWREISGEVEFFVFKSLHLKIIVIQSFSIIILCLVQLTRTEILFLIF